MCEPEVLTFGGEGDGDGDGDSCERLFFFFFFFFGMDPVSFPPAVTGGVGGLFASKGRDDIGILSAQRTKIQADPPHQPPSHFNDMTFFSKPTPPAPENHAKTSRTDPGDSRMPTFMGN